ncbi:hypothetical protein [Bacillus sp. FJAT-28004]|uniref:hypothetical protein n=1 Tax=Bacillus sp. FJAT-28004 TaxID=1679165 RepID=UPI0006B48E63|nr:hypothetical protein [Bacillus sp. FJAT-28004]
MLLKRYGQIDYVLQMDVEAGIEQINKVYEMESKQQSWEMYLTRYANMTQENYVSFDDFYKPKQTVSPPQSKKTKQEILDDAESILAAFRGKEAV